MATASNDGEQIEEEMPEYLRIPPSDIRIGKQIGQGGYSTVHKASWRGKKCAAKVVQTANVLDIQKEVAILSKLAHPNVIGCIGFSVDSSSDQGRCMILMELMDGDLRHLMNKRLKNKAQNAMPFSETKAVDILGQIAEGMEYLHRQGVFHGDLKASNILVLNDRRVGRNGRIHVKITDFGVSQMVKLDPVETPEKFITKKHFWGVVGTRGYQAPEVSSSGLFSYELDAFGRPGTTVYRAPERLLNYPLYQPRFQRHPEEFYTAKADTYCFAMTSYEVFSGRVPFESVRKPDIPALVLHGARPELPHGLDWGLKALIQQCWDQNPSHRPSFVDISQSLGTCYGYSEEQEQSRRKTPKCWGRLLKRSRRGMWK